MEEIDYGAIFGVEGANEQESAEPAADLTASTEETAQGANEQEFAEPAEQEQNESGAGGNPASENDKQTKDENARFAAARRKAEQERDAAIEQAKKDAQAEAQRVIDEAFKSSGLTNPYTKQPITTKAEYDEYKARFEQEKKERVIRKSGMTDAEFNEFVSNLPEVREARQAKQAAEDAARQAQEQQAKIKVDEQIKEINAMNPGIKELKDLAGMENYQAFYELVKKGNTLVDAYKLANFDALTNGAAAASRQAAINAANSKQHLTATTSRGAGAVSVPQEVKDEYRAFNPDATDAEIAAHYNKYVRK